MDIVYCLDDNFVMPCGVLLLSVCENNKAEDIVFHIITEGLRADNRVKLEAIVKQYGRKICFYNIDTSLLKSASESPGLQKPNWTLSVYYRLLLGSVLPENIDKVLYLDCDTIVCDSLSELWSTNLENYAIGAVYDYSGDDIRIYNRLDYDSSLGYFNAGVLLINLRYWRTNKIESLLLEYMNRNVAILKYNDQDVLNYVLREQKRGLPMKYNLMKRFFWQTHHLYLNKSRWSDMFNAIQAPVIIHYTPDEKPWHKDSTFHLDYIWRGYYRLSPWKNEPLTYKASYKQRLKMKLRYILRTVGLLSPEVSMYRSLDDKLQTSLD